ncbi:Uncharacterized protein dnl_41120 [Desulfonema limicola]|uniref:Uncharacterized protein n=1 Tax=Desulfonema limicola TaxID=45656 RepID=A0A975GIB5_9BACT|nr:hypothetical protein [Desulfonema limicola]QTA81763.1 Uncharacterized protein dnl_41120 [Desulfonema limicola]
MIHYQIKANNDPIRDKMAEIDDHVASCVYVKKNQSFLKKLFPDKDQREAAEHELRLSHTEFNFRERALEIARNAQLRAIEEMYNDYLVRGKIPIRRERSEFILEQKKMLENRLMQLVNEFENSLVAEYERAENISIPSLKNRKFDMLEKTIENYYELIDKLRDHFREILDQGVEYSS